MLFCSTAKDLKKRQQNKELYKIQISALIYIGDNILSASAECRH